MKLRLLRDGDVLEEDTLLARGCELDPDVLRADARRYHGVYGTYGISLFAVRGLSLDEMAQQVPLVRFRRMTLVTAGELTGAGLRLEPRRVASVPRRRDGAGVLATSLFGDVAAALREHGSATLDERCYYVRRPD